MANNVLLAKGLDENGQVVEVRGDYFTKTGSTGVANSIKAVQKAKLMQVPSYLIGEGRVAAGRDAQTRGNVKLALEEPVWNQWHDTFAETDTIVDKKGILGKPGELYVVSFQNGGFFVHDHKRIKDSVQRKKGRKLTSQYSMPLGQETEVDDFLDALQRKDTSVLMQKGWFKEEGSLYLFNGFEQFDEESARGDFLADMPSYAVLRTAEAARQNPFGYRSLAVQRDNEDLAIPFAGKKRLGEQLDVAGKLGWSQFSSWHDGYVHENSGRVVFVDDRDGGVGSGDNIGGVGRSVGVVPEVLEARTKIVSPLPLESTVAKENVRVTDYASMVNILGQNYDRLSPEEVSGLAKIVSDNLSTRGQ